MLKWFLVERGITEEGQVSCTETLADKDDRVDNVGVVSHGERDETGE